MEERILKLIKSIEDTQVKTIEILHRIENRLQEFNYSGTVDFGTSNHISDNHSKYIHLNLKPKDIHGNEYDAKKMSDEQYDFCEVPYEESDFLNRTMYDGDGNKLD